VNNPTEEQRELFNAYSQSYETEANRRSTVFWVDFIFAVVAGVIAGLQAAAEAASILEFLTTWSPPAALFWLAVRETGLLSNDREHRRTAVTIQEQFDLTFWKGQRWRDAWNDILCGKPVQQRVINDLALGYRGESLRDDYWVDTSGIPANDAALLRVEQSAGWGAKGHSRYARVNRVAGLGGLILVLTVATIANFQAREIAAMLFAVAPFLVGRLQSAGDHAALARRREELESHIQELLRSGKDAGDADVRAAQDELCRMRLEHRRIPDWLYDRYADHDRKAIDTAVAQDVQLVRSRIQQTADS
jgi:hypothetical protein